ncbi:MAG TPA: TIGR02270 family protein [Archangium sp.]|uniref:TIGR02270 family protein n=1 Tax=Archangium sp. TaxID=1872627 RepID=UPI002E366DA5|nr:TIGR02270 family protein [Archangium sp.]HEX5745794.1 TIGR02270 family protein [Archangium sp.]
MMDVLEEHLDEATFLWSQWERALVAADCNLSDTAKREERLLVHLDGLVVGGESAVNELLLPGLHTDEAERISASALALLANNGERGLKEILWVLDSGDDVQRAAVGRALELSRRNGLEAVLLKRLAADDRALRLLAFQVLAFRGVVPPEIRKQWLYHDDAEHLIAALRAARALPRDLVMGLLPRLLMDSHPGVRGAAIMAGLVLGTRMAWKTCRKVAEERGAGHRQCLVVLALGGDERETEWLVSLLRKPELRPDVLWALGFSGQVIAADACLEWMEDTKAAALAGEAFSAITGLKLEGEYQKIVEEEEEALVPLEQEDLDANLLPSPEASLPVPIRDAVENWWQQARKNFERGVRYLRGSKLDAAGLLTAIGRESMRRRHVLALELSIRSRGAHDIQTRAFTGRQHAELEAALAGRTSFSISPFTSLFGA